MTPLPGRRAYLDLEDSDSEKDLLSICSAGLARKPLIGHNWFHLRLPVLLSTMATPLPVAEAAAAAASFAAEVVVVAEEASRDWREGRQEEWLAAVEVSQQAIHSLQEWRRDRLRCSR